MPIYEYQCKACGHQEEVIQGPNDAALKKCPQCGKAKFTKLLSAPSFQLKGTGWYATDFKNSGKKSDPKSDAKSETKTEVKSDVKSEEKPVKKDKGHCGSGGCC